MTTRQGIDYNSWTMVIPLTLLMIGFFSIPFSPSLDSLVLIVGLWSLIYKPLRSTILTLIKHPAFKFGVAFFVWIVIRSFHDDPIIPTHTKVHYFFHYFNVFLPIFLLPPIFQAEDNKLIITYTVIISAILFGLVLLFTPTYLRSTTHVTTFLYNNFHNVETEPAAVFFVIGNYLTCLMLYRFRHKKIALIINTLILIWFFYLLCFVQHERVAIVLYVFSMMYFGYTHYSKKISLLVSAVVVIALACAIIFTHTLIHIKAKLVYTQSVAYLKSDTNQLPHTSVGVRLYDYKAGFHTLKSKPIFGYGSATFSGGVAKKYQTNYTNKPLEFHHDATPENNYLNIALQLGVIGLGLFLAYLFFLRKLIIDYTQHRKHEVLGIYYIVLLAAFSFPAFSYHIVAITMAGLIGATLNVPHNPNKPS